MRHIPLAAAAIFLAASAASACINDTNTESAETEFRTAYQKQNEPAAPNAHDFPWGIIALSGGIGLIVGGTFAVIHFSKK